MDPTYSGLILMLAGGMCAGGVYSFHQQKLPLVAQIVLGLIALALIAYGFFVIAKY